MTGRTTDAKVKKFASRATYLVQRARALHPIVENTDTRDELDHEVLQEAITVSRLLDGAVDEAERILSGTPLVESRAYLNAARKWFRVNGLPTGWKPEEVPRDERIAGALTRVERARDELAEAIEDTPDDLEGIRQILWQSARTLKDVCELLGSKREPTS